MEAQITYERVRSGLETLKMTAALAALDNVLEAARVEDLAPITVVERLLDLELSARHDRRVETNLKFAGLPYRQRLEDFDFDAQPSIDPNLRSQPHRTPGHPPLPGRRNQRPPARPSRRRQDRPRHRPRYPGTRSGTPYRLHRLPRPRRPLP